MLLLVCDRDVRVIAENGERSDGSHSTPQSTTKRSHRIRSEGSSVPVIPRQNSAPPAGLEPATVCLEGSCSDPLSYGGLLAAREPRVSYVLAPPKW